MKFYVNTKELAGALAAVIKALPINTTNELLTGIYMSAYENTLYLKCFDLSMMIETTIPAIVEEAGQAVMPGKLTHELVSKLRGESVDFESEKNTMHIKCGRLRGDIQFFDAVNYPAGTEYVEEKTIYIKQSILRAMIRQTMFCVSNEEGVKPVLKGVLLDFTSEGVLNMVALDGVRLGISSEKCGLMGYNRSVVIPSRALKEISNLLSDSEDEIGLMLAKNMTVVRIGGTSISTRLIDDEFINYRNILPTKYTARIVVDREQLLYVIETAALASREAKSGLVKLRFDKSVVKVESNSEIANINDIADITMTGEPIDIALNSRYIADMLKAIDDERIVITLNTSITPCVITPIEGEKFYYLVLPIRILYGD